MGIFKPRVKADANTNGGTSKDGESALVCAVQNVSTSGSQSGVILQAVVVVEGGEAGAKASIQIRRGGSEGQTIGGTEAEIAEKTDGVLAVSMEDHPGEIAGQEYTLTIEGPVDATVAFSSGSLVVITG